MALSVRGNPMMGGLKKIRPGFLDEGTKISLVPRGPIKYLSSLAIGMAPLGAKVLPGAEQGGGRPAATCAAKPPLRRTTVSLRRGQHNG